MIELDVLSAADAAADRAAAGQPRAWRSRDDLAGGAAYATLRRNEFLPGAADADDPATGDPSRRTFLKVMGASMALAGLSGCRRPEAAIVPYVRKPEEVIEGVANFYTTGFPMGGVLTPLLVWSYEGRPTKVEGNPDHPVVRGATDAFAQASILNLYDPDRSRFVRYRGGESNWEGFVNASRGIFARGGVAVLAEPSSSPTLARLRARLTGSGARWIEMGPHGDDPAAFGIQAALGRPLRPLYRFSEADVIVSFDSDFLSGASDRNSTWNSREYAAGRRVDERGSMSRMYAVESTFTSVGGMADHRRRMRASDIPFFAAAVARGLGVGAGAAPSPGGNAAASTGTYAADPFVQAIVEDVRAAGGAAAFVAGDTQPPQVHALCTALNARFGGRVVSYLDTGAEPARPVGPQLAALVRDMRAGRVQTLLMLGTNPVYSLPAELDFAEALQRVRTSIHVGLHRDETARRVTWHVPQAHYLEAWGDGRAYDGTLSVVQPLIAPLYEAAHSDVEILNVLTGGPDVGGYDLVRETFVAVAGGASEEAWRTVLHDGFVPNTAFPTAGAGASAGVSLAGLTPLPEDAVEVVFRVCPKVYDGSFANNAWMQEAPDPVTKLVWDNVAMMSAATAARLGVSSSLDRTHHVADRIRLSIDGRSVELPVWVQPGHADNSIHVALGYGRELATDRGVRENGPPVIRLFNKDVDIYREGPLANGVGTNVGPLRPLGQMRVATGVAVERVGDGYDLVSTQDHGSMEGRAIVRMATLDDYRATPDFAQERETFIEGTPWDEFEPLWGGENSAQEDDRIDQAMYSENQWGMTIDLNACSGCNACVVACQSENNVPVVGKDQVGRGREMHWLRLDRYYVGGTEGQPDGMVSQVMLCQHCENAPCESVCPVFATAHSPDGLNEMTYNRCIGTRYCSNNCPYKVRRFNYYNWTKHLPLEVRMGQNPNVTVRFRGVMEKCTFCVQRIRRTQQYAHIENRRLADGEVVTACQQVCPSDAIVFGDLRNPNSRVSRLKRNPRNYALLGELAVKPRNTYLARLRNPNPRLEAASAPAEPAA